MGLKSIINKLITDNMNDKYNKKTIIPGMLPGDKNIEFFSDKTTRIAYFIQNGKTRVIDKLTHDLKIKIYTMLVNDPIAFEDLKTYKVSEALNEYVICMWGKLNYSPDVINGELQPAEIYTCDPSCRCQKWQSKLTGIEKYGLTQKEKEVLSYLAKGEPDKVIADIMNISPNTVSTHKMSVFKKLNINSRVECQNFISNY